MTSKNPFVIWHYTNQCNLHCDYCSQDAGAKGVDELTTDQKKDLVDQLAEVGPRMLGISGGEPLIAQDFWEILEYATKKVPVCIGTNGYCFNEESANRLSNLGVGVINLSLYSTNPKLHDKVRGRNGSFERVIDGIKNCKKKKIKVELSIPISRRNFNELENLIELGRELKVNEIELIDFKLVGRAKDMDYEDLTNEQRVKMFEVAYNNSNKKPRIWCFDARYPIYRNLLQKNPNEVVVGCQAGTDMYAIQPNGIVTPCTFLPDLKIGNIKEQRFKQILETSNILKQFRDRTNLEGHCGSCNVRDNCGGCRARAYADSGNFFAEDPVCKNLDFLKNGKTTNP